MSPAKTSLDRLKYLAGCGDITSLRSAVRELFSEFGKVTRIDVLTMSEAEKRRALCFLYMKSTAQQPQMITALVASRFGDELLVIVDLPPTSHRLALQGLLISGVRRRTVPAIRR